MIISDNKKIKEVQKEFSNKYPFLKIKFYKHAHGVNQGSQASEEWNNELTLGEIRRNTEVKDFTISDDMRIKDFEGQMENDFGLHVQVFRASTNNVWLQTIATDDWTLYDSNKKASALLSNN